MTDKVAFPLAGDSAGLSRKETPQLLSPPGVQLESVEIAAHDPQPWNECLQALGFLPGTRLFDGAVRSRISYRGTAIVAVSEVTGTGGGILSSAAEHLSSHGEGVTEVQLRVPDVPSARMRALAAGAEPLSGVTTRRVDDEDTGIIELARVGGAGVRHRLLSAAGAAATPAPAGQQGESIDYMVLATADLTPAARLYSRAFGLDLLCVHKIQAGEETIGTILLGGPGWALAIVAQEPPGAPGMVSAFLQAHGGAGIGHVAFRVADIVQAVSQATAAGVDFLPIPAVHHDSAADRLGYAPPNLAALRRWRIAVGRDGDGRVTYHAMTGPVSPRSPVTFGLVQRPAGTLEISRDAVTALAAARAADANGRGRTNGC